MSNIGEIASAVCGLLFVLIVFGYLAWYDQTKAGKLRVENARLKRKLVDLKLEFDLLKEEKESLIRLVYIRSEDPCDV